MAANKTIPKKKKRRKAKWLSEDALQIAEERSEKQGRKGKAHSTSQVAILVKNSPASKGDLRDPGSVPGLGRSPGEGHCNPL